MKHCIINTENRRIVSFVESFGFICHGTAPSNLVSAPISHHTDVLYRKVGNDSFIISSCQKANKPLLEELGYKVYIYYGLMPGYPAECGLNFIVNEKFRIFNPKTAADITNLPGRYIRCDDIEVKQGYTSCSLALVTENAYITADWGIYNALTEKNVKCLKIKSGLCALEGYSEGFIGGSCVKISDNRLLFFGDIPDLDEKKKIADFTAENGVQAIFIENMPLTDIGSAVIL